MGHTDWPNYIADYHRDHPGITEAALGHARHPRLGTAHEWLASAVDAPAGDVLDLACGSCPTQPHLSYSSYLGVDRSEAELDAARAAGRGPVRLGDVTALDLPDSSVDTVIMSMALMLVPLRETLSQVARVLRPGGAFVAMVPAIGPVKARDLPAVAALSLALRGPGSMPGTVTAARAGHALRTAGLVPVSARRARFPFPLRTPDDYALAVASLYTPGRSDRQLRRAEQWPRRIPGARELPVPLLRIVARSTPPDRAAGRGG